MRLNLKKALLYFFIISTILTGCGRTREKEKKDEPVKFDLPQIRQRGKLIAITGYNAYSYFIYKGQPMGYEYELLQRLGKYLRLPIEIKIESRIDKMFEMLNKGEGDLIAFNLTVTKERLKKAAFTHYHNTTTQVLVQRRPPNWRRMTLDEINSKIITNPIELDGKTIYVQKGSSYVSRLKHLEDEIGGNINIIEADSNLTMEDLIELVAKGKIDYTVADKNVAELSQAYFPNIDVSLELSLPQKIAWAVRKNAPILLDTINAWIDKMRKKTEYYVIYNKYFKDRVAYARRRRSDYLTSVTGKISKYDNLIKKYSAELGWDWRLVASLIYQESQFDPRSKSWAGAIGIMQLMPATAKHYGAKNPYNPKESIRAGFKYLKWLDNFWKTYVPNDEERIKFVLASYNIGFGHILDAMRLAKKYGANPQKWFGNVEKFLLLKSNKQYYTDPVVRNGYCEGKETVKYVREVLRRYEHYKQLIAAGKEKTTEKQKITSLSN
jgi:membrane-bound lytic murein transglycosylase F